MPSCLFFAVPGALGSQHGSQGSPQEHPGPVQASIFTDFGSILVRFVDDFSCHMSYFLLVCLDSFLVTSNHIFQNSLYKFKLFWVVSRVISELRSALHGTVAGRPNPRDHPNICNYSYKFLEPPRYDFCSQNGAQKASKNQENQ